MCYSRNVRNIPPPPHIRFVGFTPPPPPPTDLFGNSSLALAFPLNIILGLLDSPPPQNFHWPLKGWIWIVVETHIKPLNSNIKIQILICCPYTFPIEVKGRICWSISDSSCVIMYFILITNLFCKAFILQGEIWWSFLGLKGLLITSFHITNIQPLPLGG